MPLYGYAGVALLLLSEAGMFAHIEPFWTWHTPIAWSAWILITDGFVYSRRRSSWLTTDRSEFWFLAVMSIPLWVVFEGYNLLIHNWHYINLPENLLVRYFGFAWAFATVSPAIFETAEAIAVVKGAWGEGQGANARETLTPRPLPLAPVVVGALFVTIPLLWHSPYFGAPVFLGFIFLLDPINARLGEESLIGDWRQGRNDRVINLLLSGVVCGGLWEFWNYWSRAKWIYDVPIMQNFKIFEMPLAGYLGFPPFAVECFTMYVFTRHFLWRGSKRPIGI